MRKFKPFLSLIIMGSGRSLADRMDKLEAVLNKQQEYQQGSIIFFTET